MSDRPRPGVGSGRATHLALAALSLGLAACAAPERPSIVLVTIDSLRADHLGSYGYARPTSPRIDALAHEGVAVDRAWATLPRTPQSIASILTGRFPKSHGARGLFDHLSDTNTTLAEILKRAGYSTAAFTSGVFLRPGLGFEQGFDLYDNPDARRAGDSAAATVAAAAAWIGERDERTPFFLWVHLVDPIWPYDPGPPWDRRFDPGLDEPFTLYDDLVAGRMTRGALIFGPPLPPRQAEHVMALYDGEIARTDESVGALIERLGHLRRPLITALTSDHGESLGEHGCQYAHGETLYEPGLRIPLVIRYPGAVAAGIRLAGPAMNVDVAPTLLALAGIGGMQSVEGRPLLTLEGSGATRHAVEARPRAIVWAETDVAGLHKENPRHLIGGPAGRWTAASDGRYKLIQIPRPGGEILELYDLGTDPGELRNLADDPAHRADRARLYRAIKEFADYGAGLPAPGVPAGEDAERLRSLGY